jgi:hypothetical protein
MFSHQTGKENSFLGGIYSGIGFGVLGYQSLKKLNGYLFLFLAPENTGKFFQHGE